jgi:hypothetical protein
LWAYSTALVATSYGGQCGCIFWETVSINEKKIREIADLCAILISKLHKRYTFSYPHNNQHLTKNQVNTHALGNFSRDLSSWKMWVQKMMDKGDDYSKVHKAYSAIGEGVGIIREELR